MSPKFPSVRTWFSVWGGASTLLLGWPTVAVAPDASVGPNGIDALRLQLPPYNLTGRKIAIGQVEPDRPGLRGTDKVAAPNSELVPARLFFRDRPAVSNQNTGEHAAGVAGLMISLDKLLRGVAPQARLYSSAFGLENIGRGGIQPRTCLSSQQVARQNGDDLRAINFSFGESLARDPRPNASLDGNSLLTQCVDWSARVHDVLYVIAGNEGRGGIPIPTDEYNGVNVAYTMAINGVFKRLDAGNLLDKELPVGSRRGVDLAAPGAGLVLSTLNGSRTVSSGTSFAAPHVTATLALLQQYGDAQIAARAPNWTVAARRHELMKAVLMNAADKVQDPGDGSRLGMSRTILDKNSQDWLASDAYRDPAIPLHLQLGTGQLNAFRAYEQFRPGPQTFEGPVPAVGWDYNTVTQETARDYVIEQPLRAGAFFSATLAWDRLVELVDQNRNGQYDLDEEFADRGLNNLDLYLLPVEATGVEGSVTASVSPADSVEHLFFQVPQTGRYKLRVVMRQRVNQPQQNYALAWWGAPAATP